MRNITVRTLPSRTGLPFSDVMIATFLDQPNEQSSLSTIQKHDLATRRTNAHPHAIAPPVPPSLSQALPRKAIFNVHLSPFAIIRFVSFMQSYRSTPFMRLSVPRINYADKKRETPTTNIKAAAAANDSLSNEQTS